MTQENCIIKIKSHKALSFPARVFGYLAQCAQLKNNFENINNGRPKECLNTLPLVSAITRKYTPQGVIHARLSCLQYRH